MAGIQKKYFESPKRVFKAAIKSGDAVLLSEALQQMNSIEREIALKLTFHYPFECDVDITKESPLLICVKEGNLDCVKVLLECKADLENSNEISNSPPDSCRCLTPLFVAAACGNLDVLSCLVENGADVNAQTNDKGTPLIIASRKGDVNVVTFLIKHGAIVDLKDIYGHTALHHAVKEFHDSCDVLSCLIENGADVNACTQNNITPLMLASRYDLVNVVTFLIEHGANINLQDQFGNTALHHVADYKSSQDSCNVLSHLIIINGANVDARTNDDWGQCTPLMFASENHKLNQVTFLIEHGANIDLQDKFGETALHYALHSLSGNSSKVVRRLLALGASQLYNNQGLTPLLLASDMYKVSIVEDIVDSPNCTKKQRIDALELLGASFATKECTLISSQQTVTEGFKYLRCGMKERFQDPSHPLLKQPVELVEGYQYRKESQTLEELAQIEGDIDTIIMEGLTIRERILGTDNSKLLGPIRCVAAYFENRNLLTCIGLYRHAIKTAQRCNQSAISDLIALSRLLFKKVNRNLYLPREEVLLELLEQTVLEYEKEQKSRGTRCGSLFDSSMELVQIIVKCKYCEDGKTPCVPVLLRRLFHLNLLRECHGDTLLHEAVYKHCIDTVKLLLNAGFNVNAVNNHGDTPLHIAVTFVPSSDKIHLLTGMLEVLLDGGAHHDFVNNYGKTAMDMAKTDEARMILCEKRNLELKCISARAVKKFGLPYLGVVPKILEKYISMH